MGKMRFKASWALNQATMYLESNKWSPIIRDGVPLREAARLKVHDFISHHSHMWDSQKIN